MRQADREGRWMEFADLYNHSELKRHNINELDAHMHDGAPVSPQLMQELAVSSETTNPFLWGVYILLKVSDFSNPPSSQAIQALQYNAFDHLDTVIAF
jgi:hypothetical protein